MKGAAKDEVPIVYGHGIGANGEIEYRSKYVPIDWYKEFKRTINAAEEVSERLERNIETRDKSSAVGIWVKPGKYGGEGAKIELDVRKDRPHTFDIPENVNSVPVHVNDIENRRNGKENSDTTTKGKNNSGTKLTSNTETENITTASSSTVPGGVSVSVDSGSSGTLCSAIWDKYNSERRFITNEHLGDGLSSGDKLYYNGKELGEIIFSDCRDDFAVAKQTGDYTPAFDIAGADRDAVTGQFSDWGLGDLIAQDATVMKSGARTGYTEGVIKSTGNVYLPPNKVDCWRRTNQVKWGTENDIDDGDSGSPCYHPDPESPDLQMWIVCINAGRTDRIARMGIDLAGNYVFGTSAHHINDYWNYQFFHYPRN